MLAAFLINSLIVAITVIVHYEFLYRITYYVPHLRIKHRYRIVFGVFGALIAHVIEIWIFGLAYHVMNFTLGWGELLGNFNGSLMDCVYFSFTVYTTVGFGDIQPVGTLRYLTGIESLVGLVLIAWTASFLYIEMQRQWDKN